jgi:glutamate-1-semialdehyde aminotransferase
VQALFRHGVYMTPSAALHSVASLVHTDVDVDFTVEAARRALAELGVC